MEVSNKQQPTEPYRFCYQENAFFGECLPCTASVFNRLVDSKTVQTNISTRQAIAQALKEGTSLLDSFVQRGDFQDFCRKEEKKNSHFQLLSTPEKLLRWAQWLKSSLPCLIFAVRGFDAVQKVDKDGNSLTNYDGEPIMFSYRHQEAISQLSGLFMADYDHLSFDPYKLYETTQAAGFPFQLALAHKTSSGDGLRLVCEANPAIGNIADNQIQLAEALGALNMLGSTGKPVVDDSCIDASRISYCPRREDIYFIDEKRLFQF